MTALRANLAAVFRQRAADLRTNAGGADDYNAEAAKFCADVLDDYAKDLSIEDAFPGVEIIALTPADGTKA